MLGEEEVSHLLPKSGVPFLAGEGAESLYNTMHVLHLFTNSLPRNEE